MAVASRLSGSDGLTGIVSITIKGVVVLSSPDKSQQAAMALGSILQGIVNTHRQAVSASANASELQTAFLGLSNIETKVVESTFLLEEIPQRCPFPELKPDLETKYANLQLGKNRITNAFALQRTEMAQGGQISKQSVARVFSELFAFIQAEVDLLMANDATFRKITEHTVIETLKWLKRCKEYSLATDITGDLVKQLATDAGVVVPALVRRLNNRVFALEDNEPTIAQQLRDNMEVLRAEAASVVQSVNASAQNPADAGLLAQRTHSQEKFGAAAAAAHALSKHPATLQCVVDRKSETVAPFQPQAQSFTISEPSFDDDEPAAAAQPLTASRGFMAGGQLISIVERGDVSQTGSSSFQADLISVARGVLDGMNDLASILQDE